MYFNGENYIASSQKKYFTCLALLILKRTVTKDITHLKIDNFVFENFNYLGSILNAGRGLTSFVSEEVHVKTSTSSQTDKYFGFSLAVTFCKGILFYILFSNGSLQPDTFSIRNLMFFVY